MNGLITFLSILAIGFSVSCANRFEVQLKNVKKNFQKYKKHTEEDKSRLQNELETWKERAQDTEVKWLRAIVSRVKDTIKLYERFCVHREDSPRNEVYVCTQLYMAHQLIKKTRKIPHGVSRIHFERRLNRLGSKVENYLRHVEYCNWPKD